MFELLSRLNLDIPSDKIGLLENFMLLFKEYSGKINLVSRHDLEYLFEKHIYDSLAFNLFYLKYFTCGEKHMKLLDIGSGGGFPAVPLAAVYNNIDITAADSINKKINFIKTARNLFNLKNLYPLCARAEELPFGADFDICTCRAVAKLNIILEYTIPYMKQGAFFAAYKSIKADEEIQNAKNALQVLNAEVIDKIEYTLPLEEQTKRILIIIRKNGRTPKEYPRRNGAALKNPL